MLCCVHHKIPLFNRNGIAYAKIHYGILRWYSNAWFTVQNILITCSQLHSMCIHCTYVAGQWLIHRGAPRARAPPYWQGGKYHNLKAEVQSFPTVPSTWYFVQRFRCNQRLYYTLSVGVGHLPFWTLASWTMSLRHLGPPPHHLAPIIL